jgi:hypothetical protein
LDESLHNVKKNTETLVVLLKEIGLGTNADKTAYMVTAWTQNAERSQNIQIGHNSFERVEQFIYLRTTLTNQNSIQGEIKQLEVRECLLSFGAESFVLQFAIRKCKD